MIIAHFVHRRRWLSNFYNCKVIWKDEEYKSVEHAYQAAKATNRHDREWIARADGAAEAKARGRRITRRPGFDSFKDRVMLKLLWSKFTHNPRLREKLMATRYAELVHGNMHGDTYWGIDRRTGEGQNKLGTLTMYIREAIRNGTDHLIPHLGQKKLDRHKAYRQRKIAEREDANLGIVVRPLPKLTHAEEMRMGASRRKRASQRKGDKTAAMWASVSQNANIYNKLHQAKLREEAYGKVERLDPNREGTRKWPKK